MDTSALSFAFSAVFTPINMLVILGGTILGIFIGAMMILISIITIASFGSIDNFMNAAEKYLDHYYSTLGSM